jgi:hypothetical protein
MAKYFGSTVKKVLFNKDDIELVQKPEYMIREMERAGVLMARYISSIGKELPPEVLKKLASLSVFISDAEIKKQEKREKEITEAIWQEKLAMAHDVYNKLSVLCKPANAVSIKYTEFSSGFLLKNNPVVNWLIFLTFSFLVIYIVLNIVGNMQENVKNSLLIITASALGAGFYTLITVRTYLIDRSYNPRYNPTYLIRFFLGITAGCILAFMLPDLFENKYSIQVLAVVGGFSADAVGIILTRISEILIAAFQGLHKSDDSNAELKEQEKELLKKKTKLDGLELMTKIKSQASQEGVSDELKKTIDESLDKIEKS